MKYLLLFSLVCFTAFAAEPSPSKKLESVSLRDLTGKDVAIDLNGKTTVLLFISTQCPISNDYNDRMSALYRDYSSKGVHFVFVNANNNESANEVAAHAKSAGFPFPVFKDPNNALADHLGASSTPEAFLFGPDATLSYHGNIDDSRNPARAQVMGLRMALDEALAGKPVTKKETKAFGCTIKRVKKAL